MTDLKRGLESKSPRTAPEGTILCVAADGVSARILELAVAADGLSVEAATSGAGAIEVAAQTRLLAVVADSDLADMSGLDLHRRLRERTSRDAVGFLLWSADLTAAERALAYRAGVDDVLPKPCSREELGARIWSQVARRRQVARTPIPYTLAGELSTLPFTDLVGILEVGNRSGVLTLTLPDGVAEVHIDAGRVVHAQYCNLVGPPAFYEVMGHSRGQFMLYERALGNQRTIDESVLALVLEGARLQDHKREEARRTATTPSASGLHQGAADGAASGGSAFTPARPARLSGLPAERQRQLAGLIRDLTDRFSLAEFQAWHRAELALWNASEHSDQHVHVVLVSDVTTGVPALASMSSPIGDKALAAAFQSAPHVPGLVFCGRQDRTLDVVFVDARAPAQTLQSMRDRADVVILAPPEGDGLRLDHASRPDLIRLIARLQPRVLLGVGHGTLDAVLADVHVASGSRAAPVRLTGALGSGNCDLRYALAYALTAWGKIDQTAV